MVIGSSGIPATLISCRTALPLEVSRIVTCTTLVCKSGVGGTVVTVPSHSPAKAFILLKEAAASDWANATADTANRVTAKIERFILSSPCLGFLATRCSAARWLYCYTPLQQ